MESSRSWTGGGTSGTVATVARFAVVAAACAALLSFARFVDDPGAAAASAYLAVLAAFLLGAAAAFDSLPRAGAEARLTGFPALPCAALLVVLAAWTLPDGPGQGAAVVAVLALAAAWAGYRRLSSPAALAPAAQPGPPARLAADVLRATGWLLPAALAVQALFRSGELLAPRLGVRTLVVFVAMPAAAAGAVAVLAWFRGRGPALTAGAVAVLVAGGLDVAATTALAALAAGELLHRPLAPAAGGTAAPAPPRGRRLLQAAAVLALLAPFAWQLTIPAVALAAALLAGGRLLAAVPIAAAALAAALWLPLVPWSAARDVLGLALLLLPFLPWSLGDVAVERPRRAVAAAAGVLLAVAAARCAPPEALAAPLAFLALTLAGPRREQDQPLPPARRNVLILQGMWSGIVLLAAAGVAAYPWLRPDPAATVLAAVGLDPAGWQPVWAAAAAFLLAALPWPGRLARRGGVAPDAAAGPREFAGTAAVVALLLLVPVLPGSLGRSQVGSPGLLLTAGAPRVEVPLDGGRDAAAAAAPRSATALPAAEPPREVAVGELLLDGNLVHAAGVAHGTPVATVTLLAASEPAAAWELRAGDELAEWAAGRPDLAPLLAHRPPQPWVSWVAPDGTYFGRTYRARHRLDEAVAAEQVRVERHPGLPAEVEVHLLRLETWP